MHVKKGNSIRRREPESSISENEKNHECQIGKKRTLDETEPGT
jgi:hypothetical protein